MHSYQYQCNDFSFTATIDDPFTLTAASDDDRPGWTHIQPHLMRLSSNRLALAVNRDQYSTDSQHLMFVSDNHGRRWKEMEGWPTANHWGHHLATRGTRLEDGTLMLVYHGGLFATDAKDVFILPTWRSHDGGGSWEPMTAASVKLPFEIMTFDSYNPPSWYQERFTNWQTTIKPEAPAEASALFARFGRQRISGAVTSLLALDNQRLLAFMHLLPKPDAKQISICLASDDAGASWTLRSRPGLWNDRLQTENSCPYPADGLSEPSVAKLADGRLFMAMRLGNLYPMYSAVSHDNGHVWSPPKMMPLMGIRPTVLHLGKGVLALCYGSPNNTVSFSFDNGYHWPWTYRFPAEGSKSEQPATRHNSMVAVDENRLLFTYDIGENQQDGLGFQNQRRIMGGYIEWSLS